MSDRRSVPQRPVSMPVRVEGTTLRRAYTAPEPAQRIYPGDIVEYQGKRWDVLGWDTARRGDELVQTLNLQRKAREWVKVDTSPAPKERVRIVKARADLRKVTLVGHQTLLPGLEPPEPAGGYPT